MTYDWVIIGAGCAGLALANALHRQGYHGRVLLIEARQEYSHDKTWCYWARQGSPEYRQAEWRWQRLTFSAQGQSWHWHRYHDWRYVGLSSALYYQRMLSSLESSSIELVLNQSVTEIEGNANDGFVVATQSICYAAKQVLDTRPAVQSSHAILYQQFIGREYRLSRPLQYPDTVRLMCDMREEADGLMFYYLLPFTPYHVLVEPTGFHQTILPHEKFTQQFTRIEEREYLHISEQGREESGILPMGLQVNIDHSAVHYGGMVGGALRPSSGYGFLRIQRWAAKRATSMIHQRDCRAVYPEPMIQAGLDRIFLQVLRHYPELSPQIFIDLMSGKHATPMLNMMRDEARLSDWLCLMLRLPKRVFIKEALNVLCYTQRMAKPNF